MRLLFICFLLLLGKFQATAQCRYVWAEWTDQGVTDTAVASLVINGSTINMTMTANYNFDFTTSIFNYGIFSSYPDLPLNSTVPRTTWSVGAGGNTTMCFSQPVVNPVLLLSSIGRQFTPITMSFSLPYNILYDGGGNTFINNTTIRGEEGYCIIEFPGTFNCVTIFSATAEFYTNITWGMKNPLTAGFTFVTQCQNNSVSFSSATSTINAPGTIIAYQWDFGDGATSTLQHPSHTYSSLGSYNVSLVVTSDNLCNDTLTLSVALANTVNVNNPQTICYGESYTINNHTYTGQGSYYDTISAGLGCDSIVLTQLTVNPDAFTINPQVLCSGSDYTINSHTYSMSGDYYDTLTTVSGCDSVILTQLTINPVMFTDNPQHICSGEAYFVNTHFYTLTGNYFDTLLTVFGCDSVVNTRLTVNTVTSVLNQQSICNGENYYFNSHIYSSTGNYYDTLSSVSGCDSIVNTQLTVNPVSTINNPQTICDGSSYSVNSHIYTTSGVFHDTLFSVLGCDSIVITQLSVQSVSHTNNPQSICAGDVYEINAHVYDSDGIYYDTLVSSSGCDSVMITSISVNPLPVILFSHPDDVCINDPAFRLNYALPGGGNYNGVGISNNLFDPLIASAGMHQMSYIYTDTSTGCINKAEENITVHALPIVQLSVSPKSAYLQDAKISFVDLTQGAIKRVWDFGDGFTSQKELDSHLFIDTGHFQISLLVTDSFGCENVAYDAVYIGREFAFYIPNAFSPNFDVLNDFFSGDGIGVKQYNMEIYNRWGELIFETTDYYKPWEAKNVPTDTYVYKIKVSDDLDVNHEYMGRVSVIR